MILSHFKVMPVYTFRPDWMFDESDHKYIMLRNIQYEFKVRCTESHSLDTTAATILSDVYMRVPDSDTMQSWTPPTLTGFSQTLYTRSTLKEGYDYMTLDSDIYDWDVVNVDRVQQDPDTSTVYTEYTVAGRWSIFQGMFKEIVRTS